MRSYYSAQNVTDVALYTEPEEIYLMKKNGELQVLHNNGVVLKNNTTGNVVLYDATAKRETVKISNSSAPGAALLHDNSDYQLFVNGKEQICVMQVKLYCDEILLNKSFFSLLQRLQVAGTSMSTHIR